MTYFTTTFSSRSLSAVYMLFLQLHANTVINKHYLKTALLHTTSTNPSADHMHREGFVLVLESWLGSWLVFQLVLSRPANIDKLWSGSYPLPSPSPHPLFPFPHPFSSLSSPCPISNPNPARGSGQHCKPPIGSSQSPATKRILVQRRPVLGWPSTHQRRVDGGAK